MADPTKDDASNDGPQSSPVDWAQIKSDAINDPREKQMFDEYYVKFSVRDVNELVGSVVSSEFTAEAKKICSEPKVIRTEADLADFILERLQEIIAIKQRQPPTRVLSFMVFSFMVCHS